MQKVRVLRYYNQIERQEKCKNKEQNKEEKWILRSRPWTPLIHPSFAFFQLGLKVDVSKLRFTPFPASFNWVWKWYGQPSMQPSLLLSIESGSGNEQTLTAKSSTSLNLDYEVTWTYKAAWVFILCSHSFCLSFESVQVSSNKKSKQTKRAETKNTTRRLSTYYAETKSKYRAIYISCWNETCKVKGTYLS